MPVPLVVLTLMLSLQTGAWSDAIPRLTVQTLMDSSFALPDALQRDFTGADGFADDPYIIVVDRAGTALDRESGLFDERSYPAAIAEIASRLFLFPGTVRNYLSLAIQKLDAANRFEAARIAKEKGWI
jgi:hypothetical protein